MPPNDPAPVCALCQRAVPGLTRHHLIPRKLHNRPRVRKNFSRDERNTVILLCRPCHNQLHALFSESELAHNYRTLEALASHPEIARFADWNSRRPPTEDIRVRRGRD